MLKRLVKLTRASLALTSEDSSVYGKPLITQRM